MFLHLNSCFQTVTLFYFSLKNMVGGKNKNKIMCMHFYFYSSFWKNRVGCPENQKKKNSGLTELGLQVICIWILSVST